VNKRDEEAARPIAPEMMYKRPRKPKHEFDPLRDYKERDTEDRTWEPKEV
jgi:hypothetical protein